LKTIHAPIEMLALSKSTKFKQDYLSLSKSLFQTTDVKNGLIHAAEFGRYRETLLREFLEAYIPGRAGFSEGFIAAQKGEISTQLDVVIYDRNATPKLEAAGGQILFPVETCMGVGEAKSDLTFLALKEALQKLMVSKRMRSRMLPTSGPIAPPLAVAQNLMREGTEEYLALMADLPDEDELAMSKLAAFYFNPLENPQQNIVTFLVCESVAWPTGAGPTDRLFHDTLKELYPRGEDYHLRHNFLLSLEDGFFSYYTARPLKDSTNRKLPYPYPALPDGRPSGWRWLKADPTNQHIHTFASELALALSDVMVYPFSAKHHSRSLEGFDFKFHPYG